MNKKGYFAAKPDVKQKMGEEDEKGMGLFKRRGTTYEER